MIRDANQLLITEIRGGTSWSSADNKQEARDGLTWWAQKMASIIQHAKNELKMNTDANCVIFKSITGLNKGKGWHSKSVSVSGWIMKRSTEIITECPHSGKKKRKERKANKLFWTYMKHAHLLQKDFFLFLNSFKVWKWSIFFSILDMVNKSLWLGVVAW